ncbi:unnamed protein product (macronuclear) [Paramecium tetraurelia]|uniref:Protein kinase domain-containing protein n=1 Tax=Paramecium tetraurelia TaxID=5888 RepID=A0E9N9_PARTE|nr:uncharacterized protein GSPATT00024737001 [Paramecium tetraurelia]CAK92006.1 unnamed protein product [Paramecium tetraurelia]|eukprot:XP_001459403.1 hypothetical protein (macronuclear) [Paramecium tetraurelia strain d4-2]
MKINYNQLIEKLRQYNIDDLQYPYKGYQGQQAQIFGCRYNMKNKFILKVIEYENEQSVHKELEIYNHLKQDFNKNENLVAIKSVLHFQDLKNVCILMDECDCNLKTHKDKLTNLESRLIFFQQFLQGYKSLYDHKVIHRDIKPENILISFKDNKPIYKLTDFGVSKLCEEIGNTISQLGTQQYAAPELQKKHGQSLPQFDYEKISKIDVYSIGLVLYELQFQRLPFGKPKTQNQFFDTSLKTRLVSQEDVSYEEGWFIDLIMQMIQTNPDERVGFEKLFKCYDKDLFKFISNLKRLAENQLLQMFLKPQVNIFNQRQGENQHRNNNRQYSLLQQNQAQFFNQNFQQQQCQTDRTYKK